MALALLLVLLLLLSTSVNAVLVVSYKEYARGNCEGAPRVEWNPVPAGVCLRKTHLNTTTSGGGNSNSAFKFTCTVFEDWPVSSTCEGNASLVIDYGSCINGPHNATSTGYSCEFMTHPVAVQFGMDKCVTSVSGDPLLSRGFKITLELGECTAVPAGLTFTDQITSYLAVQNDEGEYVVSYFVGSGRCSTSSGSSHHTFAATAGDGNCRYGGDEDDTPPLWVSLIATSVPDDNSTAQPTTTTTTPAPSSSSSSAVITTTTAPILLLLLLLLQ